MHKLHCSLRCTDFNVCSEYFSEAFSPLTVYRTCSLSRLQEVSAAAQVLLVGQVSASDCQLARPLQGLREMLNTTSEDHRFGWCLVVLAVIGCHLTHSVRSFEPIETLDCRLAKPVKKRLLQAAMLTSYAP